MKQNEDMISLGDLAVELGIKKSMLNYYYSKGLLKEEYSAGKMKVFKRSQTLKNIKKIMELKKEGRKLKDILELI